MRKLYLLLLFYLTAVTTGTFAQTSTEQFETESNGSTSFTDNGVIFNIISNVNTYDIQAAYPGTGWSGTAIDNRYIDNSGTGNQSAGTSFSIKTTSNLFKVNRFWVYAAAANTTLGVAGTLTITGKLSGVTKFTQTKTTGFTSSIAVTNGYTLIDMTNLNGQNYSNIVIDQLQITAGGNFQYLGFDAFTWVKDSGVVAGSLSLTPSQTNVSCNGGSNGTATVSASGGTAPYTYSWSPTGGTAATATGLAAGTYTVTVTDAVNNTKTQSFTITEPTALVANAVSQTNVACNGAATGAATVSASGGTGPYTYSWSPSGGTAATATGLSAGTYTVTITDAN
ncbi:SprB repeat-containing protein, partial [Epilithonimonas sp.]|uniref:SprB repeat-containing protein n=1 Tax=Epilithonimonas sp. TaxID=2894511 RepID=UPI0035AFEF27